MQIDGHHALTYIAARFAGFSHNDADIIAYSAQYVDDTVDTGIIRFTNGAMYSHISSSHKMQDLENLNALNNHQVWLPFHFLPGNANLVAGQNPQGSFTNKIRCTSDSPVARDIIKKAIAKRDAPWALHRLGVTMHVYADTFSHQGFTGESSNTNTIDDIHIVGGSWYEDWWTTLKSQILELVPLGHGPALELPDQPYTDWQYHDHEGKQVIRNNPKDFLEATDKMCRAMQCYRAGDTEAQLEKQAGIPQEHLDIFAKKIKSFKNEDGEKRHAMWLKFIKEYDFPFMVGTLAYVAHGKGSWKHQALGHPSNHIPKQYEYSSEFLSSNWKLFHDAILAYRFDVVHDILPQYGICAA